MKTLINKTVVFEGKEYTISKEEWNCFTKYDWKPPILNGQYSPYLADSLIYHLHKKYRLNLNLHEAHELASQLLEVEKSWLFDQVSRYESNIRNPRRIKTVDDLRRDTSIVHEWRDTQAKVGEHLTFEEFAKTHKKNHLLNRPPNASPNAIGTTRNGQTLYYKTDRSELENYYKKRWIKSVILKPESTGGKSVPLGVSKIGGLADLPVGEDYPIGNDGHAMRLLCQINTEEVVESTRWSHPHPGLLSFFCSKDCYQLFTGKPHMKVVFTPKGETLRRISVTHPTASPFPENFLKFKKGKTNQLPPWESALEMQERLNRDPTMMHNIVDESFDNAQPSLYGFGKHSLMTYQQMGEKKLSHYRLKGCRPLLYFPSYLDVDKSISIGNGGAVAFFTKNDARESGDYSEVSYAYFTE